MRPAHTQTCSDSPPYRNNIRRDIRKESRRLLCGVGDSEKYSHTNATRIVHSRFAFWAKTHSILGQNASHFGPKRIPFWAKTHPILRQNVFHFAAKRFPFCGKTRSILRQNAFHFAAKCISELRATNVKAADTDACQRLFRCVLFE